MKSTLKDGTAKTLIKNTRMQWSALPEKVRHAIEAIMGSPVSVSFSQPGGYSPGTADRIVTESGSRFFVKAVGSPVNSDSPDIHRKEIRIMESIKERQLGSGLIGSYDDGEWVALVFKDIDGQHPDFTSKIDRDLVMEALALLTENPLSSKAIKLLPSLPEDVRYAFEAWGRIAVDPISDLDPWVMDHFEILSSLSSGAADILRGEFLVHTDLRKDNILISEGKAMIVDWPWAAAGAPWFDVLTVTIDAGVYNDSFNLNQEIDENPLLSSVDPAEINAVISGMMGYFFDSARKPTPAGIVSLRDFQKDEGMTCLRILRERLDP